MGKRRKRSNLYKKSKYYRRRRREILFFTFTGIALAVLFLVVLTAILGRPRSSQNIKEEAAQTFSLAEEEKEEDSRWPASPVSITVSLTGDCTLGTDEAFDYDTSLNAFYEAQGSSYFFENVLPIFSSDDLTVVNMESTLTEST